MVKMEKDAAYSYTSNKKRYGDQGHEMLFIVLLRGSHGKILYIMIGA